MLSNEQLSKLSMTVNAGAKTLTIGVKSPLTVSLPDPANAGSYFEKRITAPAVLNGDGHASENFKFGEAGQAWAVAWLNNFPIYWYWTIFSGVVYWVCSRNPCLKVMPAAANNISDMAAAAATSAQGNVFIAATVTKTDFQSLPVFGPIGSMPIQRNASQSEALLVALTNGQDGFGCYNENKWWDFPTGQTIAGMSATSHLLSTGNQVPTWATPAAIKYKWKQSLDGSFSIYYDTRDAGNCSLAGGAGADQLSLATPLVPSINAYAAATPAIVTAGFTIYGAALTSTLNIAIGPVYNGYLPLTYSDAANQLMENSLSNQLDDISVSYNNIQAF